MSFPTEIEHPQKWREASGAAGSGACLITVAICTHNRSTDMAVCLSALVPQARATATPVIIVDSGSSPTEANALRCLAELYGVDHLRLEMPGLSAARNAALDHAKTEWVAFLDDDAVPEQDWITALTKTLAQTAANVAVVGGRVIPEFPDGSCPEITDRWLLLLSCVDRPGQGEVGAGFNVCGANLSVRRAALDVTCRFPLTLGRTGTRLISGEEAYLIERLALDGWISLYTDAFSVRHRIQRERLLPQWAFKRAYWEGVSRLRIRKEIGLPLPLSVHPVKLLASLPLLWVMGRWTKNVDWGIRYAMALGSLHERFGVEVA